MKRTFLLFLTCLSLLGITAQVYWDGTTDVNWDGKGTEQDPYIISTSQQLAGLAEQVNNNIPYTGQYFRLGADIYLTDTLAAKEDRPEWTPIGDLIKTTSEDGFGVSTDTMVFRGHFDGAGHSIHFLYTGTVDGFEGWTDPDDPTFEGTIDPSTWHKALFGCIGEEGTIRNLHMKDVRMAASSSMAGLALFNHGIISDCTVEGFIGSYGQQIGGSVGGLVSANHGVIERCSTDIYVRGPRGVGGIAGMNDTLSIIRDCYARGTVYCSEYNGGGLVGTNGGLVEYSAADVQVNRGGYNYGNQHDMGGFVAKNSQGGIIRACRASGDVETAYRHSGGAFVGTNWGRIESCYATGSMHSVYGAYGSGFVGQNGHYEFYNGWETFTPGIIINCFATGKIIDEDKITADNPEPPAAHGFCYSTPGIGANCNLVNCYYINNYGIDTSVDNGAAFNGGSHIVDSAFFYTQAFVDTLNMVAAFMGTCKWEYKAGSFPILTREVSTDVSPYIQGGHGTKEDPFLIATKQHLTTFATIVNKGWDFAGQYIRQTDNITLNRPQAEWGEEAPIPWTPIGEHYPMKYQYYFRGNYDGDFHTIDNLYINSYERDYQGLFGLIEHGASIRNLGVTNAFVRADGSPGILVGGATSNGTFPLERYIISCYTSGTIESRTWMAGGISGSVPNQHSMQMYNCYTTATGFGPESSFAFYGDQNYIGGETYSNDTVYNCFSAGRFYDKQDPNDCAISLGKELNRNVYYDYEKQLCEADNVDTVYAKPTQYMQSKEFVNRLNYGVERYNAWNKEQPLVYWQWQENNYPVHSPVKPEMFYVHYVSNGGNPIIAQPVMPNSHILPPTTIHQPKDTTYWIVPKLAGMLFIGWYTDKELTKPFDYSGVITSDTTLYAKWTTQDEEDYDISIFLNEFATTYKIKTAAQLRGLAIAVEGKENVIDPMSFEGKTITLENDIFLNDTANWREWGTSIVAKEWLPIGNERTFMGTFDGKGHTIYGIFNGVHNRYVSYGLFGEVGNKAIIKNTHVRCAKIVTNVNTVSSNVSGLLVAELYGTIENCSAIGEIDEETTIGGLVGQAGYPASIAQSYAIAKLNARSQYGSVGGLVGKTNNIRITDCYALSEVGGRHECGGLLGSGEYNTSTINITRSYSVSNAPILGYEYYKSPFTSAYYDKLYANNLSDMTAPAKLTEYLFQKTTYKDWDFETVWGRKDTINGGYPYLRYQYDEPIEDDPDHEVIPVTGITLDATTVNLLYGQEYQLKVAVQPENATYKQVVWTEQNKNDRIHIDENGHISVSDIPGENGEYIGKSVDVFTAATADGNKKATCKITYEKPYISVKYEDGKNYDYVGINESRTIQPILWPDTLQQPTFDMVLEEQDPVIATLDDGVITGMQAGTAYIQITANDTEYKGWTRRYACTIKYVDVTGISMENGGWPITIGLGETRQLKAIVRPENATNKGVRWYSSDPSVVEIDQEGNIKGLAYGSSTITAQSTETWEPKRTTMTVNVSPIYVSGVQITKAPEGDLRIGESFQLEYQIYPENADNKSVRWESSAPDNISVSQTGLITGLKEGRRVEIRVTTEDGNHSDYIRLRVDGYIDPEITTFELQPLTLYVGETKPVEYTVLPAEAIPYTTIIWQMAETTMEKVAEVDEQGNVTGLAEGETMLTAYASNRTSTLENTTTVTVVKTATNLDSPIDNNVPQKVIRDGKVYILRAGKLYTLTGQEVAVDNSK